MNALLGSQAVVSEGSFIGCHGTDLLFLNLLSLFRKLYSISECLQVIELLFLAIICGLQKLI